MVRRVLARNDPRLPRDRQQAQATGDGAVHAQGLRCSVRSRERVHSRCRGARASRTPSSRGWTNSSKARTTGSSPAVPSSTTTSGSTSGWSRRHVAAVRRRLETYYLQVKRAVRRVAERRFARRETSRRATTSRIASSTTRWSGRPRRCRSGGPLPHRLTCASTTVRMRLGRSPTRRPPWRSRSSLAGPMELNFWGITIRVGHRLDREGHRCRPGRFD